MTKTRKRLTAFICVALLAIVGVFGTVAYFTDTESDVNVMTVGKVDVELIEQQRGEQGLEKFVQDKTLNPIYGIAQGEKDKYGMPVAKNYVDKIVTVENVGKNDAYIRVLVAVPAALEDPNGDASNNALHWNYGNRFDAEGSGRYNTGAWQTDWQNGKVNYAEKCLDKVTIDDIVYNIYSFRYEEPVAKDATTAAAIVGFYLDERVDWDDEADTYTFKDAPIDYDLDNGVEIPVLVQAVQADGFNDADQALDIAFGPVNQDNFEQIEDWFEAVFLESIKKEADAVVNNGTELASAVENAEEGEAEVIFMNPGEYETNFEVDGGKDITIIGSGKDTVLSGQIATTTSNAGTLTIKNATIKVDSSIEDSTGISQTSKSAIAIWGNQTVICENVTFEMSLADSTAITSWWDTGIGTSIVVKNCTFNCNGQRPIRATGNVTVEKTTFNNPYRYAVQLTAKASTATLLEKATINFKNNTIVDGPNGKDFVYGIQLEGADYGCNNCVINGSGNTIVDGGTGSAMYYCECGKVDHATIEWNVEVDPVHKN